MVDVTSARIGWSRAIVLAALEPYLRLAKTDRNPWDQRPHRMIPKQSSSKRPHA